MAVILIFAFVIVELTKESSPTLSDMEKLSCFIFFALATPLTSSHKIWSIFYNMGRGSQSKTPIFLFSLEKLCKIWYPISYGKKVYR
jgi:hypothetical protein